MTVSELRTQTRAAAVELKGDGNNLTPTQEQKLDDFIASIDSEAGSVFAGQFTIRNTVATGLPYGMRNASDDASAS